MKIIGDSSASGGRYNDAKLVGNGLVNGDLDCVNFKCVGDSKLSGNLKAATAKIVGSICIEGSTNVADMRITGNMDSTGDLRAETLVLRGGLSAKSGLKAGSASLKGYTSVKKNCEAETFWSDGQLTIGGLLNAETVDIRTRGRCRVSEIGGEAITVRKGVGSAVGDIIRSLFVSAGLENGKLVADSIEGGDIRLSHTKAKVVRGTAVIIESGCEIDLVEYKHSLRVNRGASVKEEKKI